MVKETKNSKGAEAPKKTVEKAKTEKPKKVEEKPIIEKVAEKPAVEKAAEKPTTERIEVRQKSNGQAIVIAVLATILGCAIIVFTVLFATGVIKFGNSESDSSSVATEEDKDEKDDKPTDDDDDDDDKKGGYSDAGKTSTSNIIDNPNKQVTESGTFVKVGVLEFYLPRKFEYGGKNKDGAFTYNLTNDDGWAQVLVYAEKSSLTPAKFLTNRVSSYLDITDSAYRMNGTTWVQAENAYSLAYATELDGKIYAVYYSVKLDSDATSKAMQMIPKTLYMKKIYKN